MVFFFSKSTVGMVNRWVLGYTKWGYFSSLRERSRQYVFFWQALLDEPKPMFIKASITKQQTWIHVTDSLTSETSSNIPSTKYRRCKKEIWTLQLSPQQEEHFLKAVINLCLASCSALSFPKGSCFLVVLGLLARLSSDSRNLFRLVVMHIKYMLTIGLL